MDYIKNRISYLFIRDHIQYDNFSRLKFFLRFSHWISSQLFEILCKSIYPFPLWITYENYLHVPSLLFVP